MPTTHTQIPDIQALQSQKEVTANQAHDRLDKQLNQLLGIVVTGDLTLTAVQMRENALLELTGTPGAPFTVDMFDTNERVLSVFNNTDDVATVRNSASGGAGQPIIAVGDTVTFHYDGVDFIPLSQITKGKLDLSLGGLREIVSNDIPNTAASPSGGLLTSDTTPAYGRLNGATDKALRVNWVLANVDEIQFAPIFMPPDLDETQDLTIHLLARMDGATDTPTIDVQVFDAVGDTEMGGVTAALSTTLAELTVIISAADLSGHPLGFLNVSLTPGAHGTDEVELFAAWIEYTRKVAA